VHALNSLPADPARVPARRWYRPGPRGARFILLGLAVCLSWPAAFAVLPGLGLDPSWQLSLQLAEIQHKMFGREFVFTYGPLGYLLIHAPVNKAALVFYDFFVLGSLLAIYRALLPARPSPRDTLLLMALALVTKMGWEAGPAATLFTVLGYWLWRVNTGRGWPAAAAGLVAATVLFFGKVNYGLILMFLMPAYGLGLLLLHRQRRAAGLLFLAGFPALLFIGARLWSVDLPGYLRSSVELSTGYNEAMYAYANTRFALVLACLFLLALVLAAVWERRRLAWRNQVMFLPLIGLAVALSFKNGFVRADDFHRPSFFIALPLLLAFWHLGWRGAAAIRVLLVASLFYPLALFVAQPKLFGCHEFTRIIPWRYGYQLFGAPWRENTAHLRDRLQALYPEAILPGDIRSRIGRSSVDVMPWETSVAVLNGLDYRPRPVPQSYIAYTTWLDGLNARFLNSTDAPACLLYACAQTVTLDGRVAAWDESLTRMAVLENYTFASEFSLPLRVWSYQKVEPARVFLLCRTPQRRCWVPVATNEVTLTLGQSLRVPTTTNLVMLTLTVDRTIPGKLAAAALSPAMLMAGVKYQDGDTAYYRAILPMLKTGVPVNRRIESAEEIRNWLELQAARNPAVTAVSFQTHSPWAFRTPFKGFLVEYRLTEAEGTPAVH
jgi:hypothetical protein